MTCLPKWQDEMSDGCSVPKPLRPFILTSAEARAVCVCHDEAYYYGGSELDRLRADLTFALGLLDTPDREQAERAYNAVRLGGAPHYRINGVSWGFGGECFQYTEKPKVAP